MTHFYFPHFVYYVCLLITRFLSPSRFCCNLSLPLDLRERERERANESAGPFHKNPNDHNKGGEGKEQKGGKGKEEAVFD